MANSQWAEQHGHLVKGIARAGYVSKGFIYGAVGLLALQTALGSGHRVEGKEGALKAILAQPFGQIMLGVLMLGFLGYALWRVIQGIYNTDQEDQDLKGWSKRLVSLIIGAAYGGLAFATLRVLRHQIQGSEDSTRAWTATLMSQPFGIWLVGLAGSIVIGIGLYHFYKVITKKYEDNLNLYEMGATQRKTLKFVARMGISARGLVFCLIGSFLIQAAINHNPNQAKGLGDALQSLMAQPYGQWLLGIVAVGMMVYAIYDCFQARYLAIRLP